jgi:hypothetical protein
VANLIDAAIFAFLRDLIRHWNERNVEAISALFREDAALSSPFGVENSASPWVQGRHEIGRHLQDLRSRYQGFEIVDIATNNPFYTLLLRSGRDYLTIIIEPERPPLLIRRMIICKSIFHVR